MPDARCLPNAGDRSRTCTALRPRDPKSRASAFRHARVRSLYSDHPNAPEPSRVDDFTQGSAGAPELHDHHVLPPRARGPEHHGRLRARRLPRLVVDHQAHRRARPAQGRVRPAAPQAPAARSSRTTSPRRRSRSTRHTAVHRASSRTRPPDPTCPGKHARSVPRRPLNRRVGDGSDHASVAATAHRPPRTPSLRSCTDSRRGPARPPPRAREGPRREQRDQHREHREHVERVVPPLVGHAREHREPEDATRASRTAARAPPARPARPLGHLRGRGTVRSLRGRPRRGGSSRDPRRPEHQRLHVSHR